MSLHEGTLRILLFSQELARHLYKAVEGGLLDGAKVKKVLKITREDAVEGKQKSKSYRSFTRDAGIVTNLWGDQSISRPGLHYRAYKTIIFCKINKLKWGIIRSKFDMGSVKQIFIKLINLVKWEQFHHKP